MISRQVLVEEQSQVAEGRRVAAGMASDGGFNETEVGQVSIVATELATNLLKHARGGELLLISWGERQRRLEIVALDKGPGMADVRQCLEDGYSTAGSTGSGLGAVLRLATRLEVYTAPQKGTTAFAEFHPAPNGTWARAAAGGLSIPIRGEQVCGDAWDARQDGDTVELLVADGLGHGPGAAEASGAAVEIFRRHPGLAPKDMVETIHQGLQKTRGAAIGAARIDLAGGELRFAGVGNTSGVIVGRDGRQHSVLSHNGTAGMAVVMRTVQEYAYPFPEGAVAIFHSDGLATHWNLSAYPGLGNCHPTLLAAVLYRDFKRGRDDVTVVSVGRRSANADAGG
ncbi:MAG TPA: SpoIIE family protein phosphatase [Bryobacteraceae bacterium]|jgi:anti-sigma regulatory factor (Ser/Thr protein kinase)|nr:SpoIIE family protein phosphatase [Bryobacteraceae bacterium]